ncbi:MAG: DUF1501 domain-containing protein [Planctomycetota bacterium]
MASIFPHDLSRRALLGGGLGAAALALLERRAAARRPARSDGERAPDFAPRAKRVIYLCQSGGPSQVDLFDHHPELRALHGDELPDSVRGEQRVTGMTAGQASFPVVASPWEFRQHGESGAWVSALLPYTAQVVDRLAFLKAVHTEAINHDPAITWLCTGNQIPGKASLGSWLSYGLGSENQDLPAYLVLISQGTGKAPGQPIFSRLWGSGYLPAEHQGVRLRSGASPVLFLNNPPGIDVERRRRQLDDLARLEALGRGDDPGLASRIAQYELAFRMQRAVPDLVDLSDEPDEVFELYGPDARTPGTYAANCLLARRLAERGVRCVQLFHRGWDQHLNLERELGAQCRDTDQPSAALVLDLERRGLLEDTLVVWGGEFGRTVYSQGTLGDPGSGRDHHGRCFTMWLAGGGVAAGVEHGRTDTFSWNVVEGGVHVRDLNATILHLLGLDHERLAFPFQGLQERLTGVEPARVVREVLA